MSTLIEHVLKFTDHRDRELLELTLSRALIDLLPLQRVVISRVMTQTGDKRWLEVARLDAKGGGKVLDSMRVDFQSLADLADAPDRLKCLQDREMVEIAWAGPDGPRIYMLPLFSDSGVADEGVIEIHSSAQLTAEDLLTIEQLRRMYCNMYALLEFSDRDPLTGLMNRKSLDDAFYKVVLEELDGLTGEPKIFEIPKNQDQERRSRVPANYWLGSAVIDEFEQIDRKQGHQIAEEVLLLVARLMSNTFRMHDRLYRFGSGHFGVLMHCPDEVLVLAAFERFRVNVEKFNFPQAGHVTVSCGYTSVMADDSPSSTLEKTALAVKFVQRSGRNKVCSHLGLERRGFLG